jgi:hypothetical protein
MQSIRYPAIQVKLIGRDSNARTVVAAVSRALEQAGVRHEEIANFYDEALSGDYNRVLQTALRWITVV